MKAAAPADTGPSVPEPLFRGLIGSSFAALPLAGPLVRYRGWLHVDPQ